MNTVQATCYGAKSLIHLLLGHVPEMYPNSTVNEGLDIHGTDRPVEGEKVRLGVLVVGNKGSTATVGDQGIPLTSIVDHTATDAGLYNMVPMLMRPTDGDDIPLDQRKRYCLRKIENHGGVNYYVYYGLRMNISPTDVNVNTQKITTEDGAPVVEDFRPTTANLFPNPINLPSAGAVTATDVKIAVSCVITVKLTEADIQEYINVAKILHGGDERYAIMSEFALCTGADRAFSVESTSGTINFLESIGTQIYSFSADHKAVYYNAQELTIDFDIGNQVPMLGVQSIPTLEYIP